MGWSGPMPNAESFAHAKLRRDLSAYWLRDVLEVAA